ncbi:hypothetical protein DPMN_122750 [Dreissena polymorpha]|uniref:Uncharacterized protein n=1 Tax=Dreissena polymorpha TaxID=45954 RepID=A0A9D4GW44_DREPO|nr:hypothetical protein DPMN_122750 [Dreissena polymorpha]
MNSVMFNASISVAEAIGSGLNFGLTSKQGEVAIDMHKSLKQAFVDAKPLPWPPTADDFEGYSPEDIIPKELLSFLTKLICGESEVASSEKYCIILSIAQVSVFDAWATVSLMISVWN